MPVVFRKLLSKKRLAECASVTETMAPELRDRLYFVNLPRKHPEPGPCVAFAAIGKFSFEIVDAIKEAGMWQGPRPMIVFCRRMDSMAAQGVLIHELSHLLPYSGPPEQAEATSAERAEWSQYVAARITRRFVGESPKMPAWYQAHGLAFIRRCLHLHARAWMHRIEVGLPDIMFAGPHYDLSAPWKYMNALGDEPQRMLDADFATIEATKSPAEFYELFCDDFQRWWCGRMLDTRARPKKENKSNDYAA